jgi:hypothetical protein
VVESGGISGIAYGGRQPIVGSTVTVWAAGSTGVGSGATSLATTTTNSSGQFNIAPGTYSCSAVTTPLYITAQSGNPGNSFSGANPTGNNPDIFLVAALGTCGTAVQNSVVTINEVTTVAAAVSMSSYIKASNFGGSSTNFGMSDGIGSSSGTGLPAAFTSAGYLANTATGTSPGASSLTTLATPTIYEMANVLAACVNSDPLNGSTTCSTLFANASPATSTSTPTAGNTFEVAYYLATNPTSTNASGNSQIATVYGLASPQSPYQPALSSAPSSWSVASSCDVPSGASNVPVPTGCAYFGAWANPVANLGTSPSQVSGYTKTLEGQVGRTLSLHMHYYGWGTTGATVALSTPSFPDQAETDDATAGRTPVITWSCNLNTTNSAVGGASTTFDVPDYNLIVATAQAVKAFGKPMFIRWNWEMNLNSGTKCMDSSNAAAGYILAWQNIYNIFNAQGVTNVSWLWNPAGARADPNPTQFYPGVNYVDWIGYDGYDKVNDHDFGDIFNYFYSTSNSGYGFGTYGKPILIAETGECLTYQQNYLNLAVAEIAGRSNNYGYSFPMVRGFMYFDSPGQYTGCSSQSQYQTWSFDTEGITGFTAMGADPYFVALP